MEIKEIKEYPIMAWYEEGNPKGLNAVAAIDKTLNGLWFNVGMNVCRDGDMGSQNVDGDFDRLWYTDFADETSTAKQTMRYATPSECERYLRKVSLFNATSPLDLDAEMVLVKHFGHTSIYVISKD